MAHPRRDRAAGPDRLTVGLLAVAGFLAVLALLAWQLRSSGPKAGARAAVTVRRVYETKVIETIIGPASRGASSVTQSVSSSGSPYAAAPALTTRTS